MSTLNKVEQLISIAHDEVLIPKKWDIKHRYEILTQAYDKLYPFSLKYYFEANPSFLNDYSSFEDMERYPLIMLRDGFVSLFFFFLRAPKPPEGFRSILLIPDALARLVPTLWKSHCAFYRVNFLNIEKTPNRLIVGGSLAQHSFWSNTPEEAIAKLKNQIPKNCELSFFIPIKDRLVFHWVDESKYIGKAMRAIHENFGNDIKIIHEQGKAMLSKMEIGDAYFDLGDLSPILYDNFLHHWFASKGISINGNQKFHGEKALTYKLSPYHSVSILEAPEDLGADFNNLAVRAKLRGGKIDLHDVNFHHWLKEMLVTGVLKIKE